jgi:hypothetical protein
MGMMPARCIYVGDITTARAAVMTSVYPEIEPYEHSMQNVGDGNRV